MPRTYLIKIISFIDYIMENKLHWENIYQTKKIDGVSWYQETPSESIELIKKFSTTNSDMIIDIGCGKSFLADNLLKLNYKNITLVDISKNALKEVKERLNDESLNFIETDVLNLKLEQAFDIWHDRAVFHFIIEKEGVEKYISTGEKGVEVLLEPGDCMIYLGTECEHWREPLLEKSCSQVFLHYRETKNVTDDGWDKRLGSGMPHFTRRNDK